MKKWILRVTLLVSLLLVLGAVINVAPAYAATTSAHVAADSIYRVDCSSSPDLIIIADNYANKDCFSGSGGINVAIYNVTYVCTYNDYYADVLAYWDYLPTAEFEYTGTDWCAINTQNPINEITEIGLNYG